MTSRSQEEPNPLAHGSNVVCDHCKDFKNLPSSAHSTNRIPLCQSAPVPNEPSDDPTARECPGGCGTLVPGVSSSLYCNKCKPEPSDDIKTGKPIETSFDRTRKEVQSHEPSEFNPEEYEIVSESRDLVAYRRKKPVPSDERAYVDKCTCGHFRGDHTPMMDDDSDSCWGCNCKKFNPEPSDSRPCPGCGKPVSNVSSMMYCQDCQLKQNERVSAIGDELDNFQNRFHVWCELHGMLLGDFIEEDGEFLAVVNLDVLKPAIMDLIEEQTKLARIETAYYIDSMLTFEGIPLRLTQRESIKVYIRQLEASIKERSEDE